MNNNVIVAESLSKKFCRTFKRSLWYGVRDIGSELTGSRRKNMRLRKDEFWALKDLNFELKQGELIGLIGPNGSGKTTLLRLLSGLIRPDQGEVTIRGEIRSLIALGAGFNPVLTGRENVYVNGAVLGLGKNRIDGLLDEIAEFSELKSFMDMPVQSYSSGMMVRLGFSIAVHMKPDILLVDEVLAVGDATFRRKARRKMIELLHSGISVIFVSHNIPLVSALTSRCIYLDLGRIVDCGPSDAVTSRYLSDSLKRSMDEENDSEAIPEASAYLTTPDFSLEKVRMTRSDGVVSNDFSTHQDIHVRFDVRFLKRIEHVVFGISIRSHVDDVVISSSKTLEEKDFDEGMVNIECQILNNTLREGIFNLGFYVSHLEGGALYKSHGVKTFRILADMDTIKNSGSSLGFMVMNTIWKLEPER
jgi:lipopolysaccharide transport system ATP-binding protein